jgi:hypothetical protein
MVAIDAALVGDSGKPGLAFFHLKMIKLSSPYLALYQVLPFS